MVCKGNVTISLTAAARARKVITTMKHKLKNLEQLRDLSFTLVGCWQNLNLLLWKMKAEEVLERKGRRNNEAHL